MNTGAASVKEGIGFLSAGALRYVQLLDGFKKLDRFRTATGIVNADQWSESKSPFDGVHSGRRVVHGRCRRGV